jgi:Peptidase M15
MADLSNVAWNQFPRNANPVDLVSPNFSLRELTRSDLASRMQIDNAFPGVQPLRAAVYLCRNVLEPVRAQFGSYSPNSVFRSQDLERALKKKRKDWVSKSQHTEGQACDIEVQGVANMQLARWVAENLEFDQLILECYNAKEGPNSGWVHISVLAPGTGANRKEILSYIMNSRKGEYVYVEGLRETA